MAREVLLEDERVLLERDPSIGAVIMTRTEVELPRDLQSMRSFFERLVRAVASVDRPSHDFVIDARETRGRNDEVFEQVRRELHDALFGGFRSVAVVVRSNVGKLQVQRYNAVDATTTMKVYDDLDAALRRSE